jgi:hypothetical protein
MPVVFTFDIEGASPIERNRIQSFFERFGWENIGGSSYRYPRLGTRDQPVEDWFNHVIPALMLFRTYILSSGRRLRRHTLDVQTSSGFNSASRYGRPPRRGRALPGRRGQVQLYDPNNPSFGEGNLRDWLNNIAYPYP